jgi:hypothetical protein
MNELLNKKSNELIQLLDGVKNETNNININNKIKNIQSLLNELNSDLVMLHKVETNQCLDIELYKFKLKNSKLDKDIHGYLSVLVQIYEVVNNPGFKIKMREDYINCGLCRNNLKNRFDNNDFICPFDKRHYNRNQKAQSTGCYYDCMIVNSSLRMKGAKNNFRKFAQGIVNNFVKQKFKEYNLI